MPGKQNQPGIGLSELIYQVKQDLLSKKEPDPLFAIERLELEISFTVSREANGGINIQVFSLGGGVSRADAQTVRVSLVPLVDGRALAEKINKEDLKKALLKGVSEDDE